MDCGTARGGHRGGARLEPVDGLLSHRLVQLGIKLLSVWRERLHANPRERREQVCLHQADPVR
jgi:hypothetical protein